MEETYMLTQCNTMLMGFFFFQKKLSFGTNGYFQSKHDSSSINQQSLLDWSTRCPQNVGKLAILHVQVDGELELVSGKITIILLSQMSI